MTDCQFELDMSKELVHDIADNYNTRMEALPESAADLTVTEAVEVVALVEGMKNLTDTQKALLDTALVEKVNALATSAQEKIKNIEAVEELIDALPHVSELTLEDAEAVNAAANAYDALSDEEKALVNTTLVNKLNSLKAKLEKLSGSDGGSTVPETGDTMTMGVLVAMLMSAACAVWICGRKRNSF